MENEMELNPFGDSMPEGNLKSAAQWVEAIKVSQHGLEEWITKDVVGDLIAAVIKEIDCVEVEEVKEVARLAGLSMIESWKQRPQMPPQSVVIGAWLDGLLAGLAVMQGKRGSLGDVIAAQERSADEDSSS